MALFGITIRPSLPASAGGLTTQSTGGPASALASGNTVLAAPIASLTVPVTAPGTGTTTIGSITGVRVTLIPTAGTPTTPAPRTGPPTTGPTGPMGPAAIIAGGSTGRREPAASFGTSIADTLGRTAGPVSTSTLIDIQRGGGTPLSLTVPISRILQQASGDVINVAETRLQNGQFYPIVDSGVHNFRPEIILNSEFNTIWEPGELTVAGSILSKKNSSTGDFLNFQFQTKQLRQETIGGLIKNIQKTLDNPDVFKDVKKDYTDQLNQVSQDLGYLESIVSNVNIIKNAFDIKNIPLENYEFKNGDAITKIRTLRQLFNEKMQYSPTQFDNFSNTKILLQLLFDLENMLSAYSVNLLDLRDNDRTNDNSPIRLDRTYTTKNSSFSFNISNLASLTTVANAANSSFFTTFLGSLPANPNDRIKLLTYLLAKEYSVSRGLGDTANRTMLQAASYDPTKGGSPFKNVIGVVGDTIFESPLGIPDSLASLMYIDPASTNVKILTFENKYVDSDDQQYTYVPGTSFFTDAILTVDGKAWNSNSLTTYINRYNTIVRSVRTMIGDVFGLDSSPKPGASDLSNTESSVINPVDMNKSLLLAIKSSYGTLAPSESQILEITTNTNSATVQRKLLLEYQINFVNNQIIRAVDDTTRSAYNSQITALRAQLASLSLPNMDEDLKMSLDKATIMAIFKFASSGHDDIKLLLFQYCILAGLIRNNPGSNASDIFSLLAATEIRNTNQLGNAIGSTSNILALSNQVTTDGYNLVTLLSTFARELEQKLIAALEPTLQPAGRQWTPEGTLKFFIQQSNLSDLLYKCALGEGPAGDSNLIYQFVTLVNKFFNSGRINGQNTHLVADGSNVTKYSYLSCSTQMLFVYEILCQYAAAYGTAKFVSRDDTTGAGVVGAPGLPQPNATIATLGLAIDFSQMNSIDQAMDLLTNSTSEDEKDAARRANNQAFINLEANKNRIAAEYDTIKEMIANMKIIGDHLQSSLAQVQSFFNQTELQSFLKNSPVTNLNLLRNYSQLRLASYIYNDIKERTASPSSFMDNFGGQKSTDSSTAQSDLIISDTTTLSEYNSLISLLSNPNNPSLQCLPSPEQPADVIKRNNKILAVGIPAGFSRELADRVNKRAITVQSFKEKQSDVIVVNVYMRNLKFNDIVFKPFKYVFDLSLFATKKDFVDCNSVSGEDINRIFERITLTDLDNPFSPQKVTTAKIVSDPKYDFLSATQKNDLIKNHVSSYLLNIYIQYITGVKTTEDVFLEPAAPAKQLTTKAKTILDTYIKQTFGVTNATSVIKDILTSKQLPEGMKDAYRLMTYGSLMFSDNEVRSKVLTPKLFDRIFYVPVNVDNAEVDYTATLSTAQGRTSWGKEYTQSFIRRVANPSTTSDTRYYLNANNIDDFIINDMFVSVETANDTVAQDTQPILTLAGMGTIAGGGILR